MLVGGMIALLFIFGLFFSMVSTSPKAPREGAGQDVRPERRFES